MRAGSFYNVLWMFVIIFATICYIQLLANINLPLNTSLEDDTVTVLNGEERLFHTSVAAKHASETDQRGQGIVLSFKRNSSLVTQWILRSTYAFISNQTVTNQTVFTNKPLRNQAFMRNNTLNNLTADFHVLKNSSANIRINNVIVQRHNGSDVVTNKSLPVLLKEDMLLNTNKVVSNDNDIPEIDNLGIERIINNSVINHSNFTYLHEHISKNRTMKEHRNLPNVRKSRRPNYCPLWPSELGIYIQPWSG